MRAVILLLAGLIVSPGERAEAQVRELLQDLLRGGNQGRIESVETGGQGSHSATLLVRFSELENPEGVTVTARVMDTRLRQLSGFSVDPVVLDGAEGVVEAQLRYSGGEEVTSLSVEVRLERSGDVLVRKMHGLAKVWGEDSGGGDRFQEDQAPIEDSADEVAQREPREYEIDPVPMGDTPTGSTPNGGPSGPASDPPPSPPIADPVRADMKVKLATPMVFMLAKPRLIPLYSWWSGDNQDHLATSDSAWAGPTSATKQSYRFYRREGFLYPPEGTQPAGTKPLYRWWSPSRKDYFTTTNPAWKGAPGQSRDGYQFVRLEGYVLASAGSGRLPLKSYWSPSRTDNVATADPAWNQAQRRNPDYRHYLIDGYLLSSDGTP